jgi:hypothetical protein
MKPGQVVTWPGSMCAGTANGRRDGYTDLTWPEQRAPEQEPERQPRQPEQEPGRLQRPEPEQEQRREQERLQRPEPLPSSRNRQGPAPRRTR